MDTIKNPQLSLERMLVSYNILVIFFIIFVVLMVVLQSTNPKGFNKYFGYEIFITGPILIILGFLIKEIFTFKNDPKLSWLANFSQSNQNWFIPVLSLIAVFIAIFGFFMMLYVGGIFSDKQPENNISMLFNFIVIIFFIVISAVIYKNRSKKDEIIVNTLPKPLQDAFYSRTKYTVLFFLFALFITILFLVNPWNITTNYGSPVIFFSLFVGIILLIMITIYQYFLDNTSKASLLKDSPGFTSLIYKSVYILVALTISFGLIYGALKLMGVFEQDASKTESWGNLFFNLIVFCAMLGIIYKLANAGGYLDKNPFYRLILNTLLYIPCLLVIFTNNVTNVIGLTKTSTSVFDPPKPYEIKILVISLILIVLYFGWIFAGKHFIVSKYLKQGGKQLINQPIQTDILTNVASYQTLSGSDKFDYRYAMSFWLFLDSFPPSTNSAYNKTVSLLSYGDNPMIKYSSTDNTIYITIKHNIEDIKDVDLSDKTENDEDIKPEHINQWKETDVQGLITTAIEHIKTMKFGNELDTDGNRILYKHPNVQLQKWNHIVLNYNGGTLDIFYNGKLVKSAINVVPYMKFDMLTVGTENGVSGNIANLMYYNEPIDILTINTLYTSLKNSNPPVISDNNSTLLSPL